MSNERLLERIRDLEDNPTIPTSRHLTLEIRSVINHLSRLLNTQQGNVIIADDYGIPDFTNFSGDSFSEAAAEIVRSLKLAIAKYERRLQQVTLSLDADHRDPFTLRFKLEAYLVGERNTPVIFDTVISTDGKIEVTEG